MEEMAHQQKQERYEKGRKFMDDMRVKRLQEIGFFNARRSTFKATNSSMGSESYNMNILTPKRLAQQPIFMHSEEENGSRRMLNSIDFQQQHEGKKPVPVKQIGGRHQSQQFPIKYDSSDNYLVHDSYGKPTSYNEV